MTDLKAEIEKKIEQAAEKYATGNHTSSFADTADARAFSEGANLLLPRLMELVAAADHYSRWLEQNNLGTNSALHRALTSLKSWAGGK